MFWLLRNCLSGAERGSRFSQGSLMCRCARVRGTKNAPRDWGRFRQRRHGLAEIVERGAGVFAEHPCVIPSHRRRRARGGDRGTRRVRGVPEAHGGAVPFVGGGLQRVARRPEVAAAVLEGAARAERDKTLDNHRYLYTTHRPRLFARRRLATSAFRRRNAAARARRSLSERGRLKYETPAAVAAAATPAAAFLR